MSTERGVAVKLSQLGTGAHARASEGQWVVQRHRQAEF